MNPDGAQYVQAVLIVFATLCPATGANATPRPVPRLVVQNGHRHGVAIADFSPDDTSIAIAGDESRVIIWDLGGGFERRHLSLGETARALAFSSDGTTIVTADAVGQVLTWLTTTDAPPRVLAKLTPPVWSVTTSRDGRFSAVAHNGTVTVIDASHDPLLWNIEPPWARPRDSAGTTTNDSKWRSITATMSSDSRYLLVSAAEAPHLLYDLASRALVRLFPKSCADPGRAAFSIDGRYLRTSGYCHTASPALSLDVQTVTQPAVDCQRGPELVPPNYGARCWHTEQRVWDLTQPGNNAGYSNDRVDVTLFPMSQRLIADTAFPRDERVHESSTYPWLPPTTFGDPVFARSHDGTLLLTYRPQQCVPPDEYTLRYFHNIGSCVYIPPELAIRRAESWDIVTRLSGFGAGATFLSLSSDGRTVLAATDDRFSLWNTDTGRHTGTSLPPMFNWYTLNGVLIGTPQQKVGERPSTAYTLWDVDTLNVIGAMSLLEDEHPIALDRAARRAIIRSVGPSSDELYVLDIGSGQRLRLSWPNITDGTCAISADGTRIVAPVRGAIGIWDVPSDAATWLSSVEPTRVLQTAETADSDLRDVSVALTGAVVVGGWTATGAKWVRSYDSQTGVVRWQRELECDLAAVTDDGLVVLSCEDRTWMVLDLDSGEERIAAIAQQWGAGPASLTRSGKLLLQGNEDGLTSVIDVKSGAELFRMTIVRPEQDGKSEGEPGWFEAFDGEGRFATPDGVALEGVYWMVGEQRLKLLQLADAYYEPDLVRSKLGLAEPLRPVASPFEADQLPPTVKAITLDRSGKQIEMVVCENGGGIGEIRVYVNDQLIQKIDGGSPGLHAEPERNGRVCVHYGLMLDEGLTIAGVNQVRVDTANARMTVRGQSATKEWSVIKPEAEPPRLFGVFIGVYDYPKLANGSIAAIRGNALRVSSVVARAAEALFPGRVSVQTLCENGCDNPPTKANIVTAFGKLRDARPQDVVVVYLNGHGVLLDGGYALALDGVTNTGLGLRRMWDRMTLRRTELQDWLGASAATHKLLIVESCYAGDLVTGGTLRAEVESSRDLADLGESSGAFVIASSTAFQPTAVASGFADTLLRGMLAVATKDARSEVRVLPLYAYVASAFATAPELAGWRQFPVLSGRGRDFAFGVITRNASQQMQQAHSAR